MTTPTPKDKAKIRAEMLAARKRVFAENPGISLTEDVAAKLPAHLRDEYRHWNQEA